MNLNPEEQISIAEKLAEIGDSIPECGVVLAAPIRFVDKADFQKNAGNYFLSTQKEMELSEVALTVITFSKLPKKPEKHGGWWSYFFNLYIFREYDSERLDESETPDDFRKRVLKSYYDFVNAILNLSAQIGEELQLDVSSENILDCVLRQQEINDFIDDDDECRFVPGVTGYSTDFPVEVKVRFREC